ncbi:MAG: GspJ family T2SS minor pseudopilin variant ExeJ [Wenzhouxiangellaceae bacterium]
MSRQSGFTLIELLLAVTVFTLVLAGGYAAVNGLSRAWQQQREFARQFQQLQATWYQLEQDLTQIIARRPRDSSGGHLPAVSGSALQLQAVRSGWSNPLAQQRSELQRFGYQLRNGQLWRNWWLNTDSARNDSLQQDLLLDNVQALQLRYLDSNREWQLQWPPGNATGAANLATLLPLAIEVDLLLADDARYRRVFATVALN